MKATEQYFSVVLFIILYKVVLPSQSVNEILECDHSLPGTVYHPVHGVFNLHEFQCNINLVCVL